MVKKRKRAEDVHPVPEFQYLIELERGRVHREGHQFSLVTFRLADGAREERQWKRIVSFITNRVRRIDQLGWYDNDHIGLLLPHTSIQGARKVAGDISNSDPVKGYLTSCDLYVYP